MSYYLDNSCNVTSYLRHNSAAVLQRCFCYFITFCRWKIDRKPRNYVVCSNFAQSRHLIGLTVGIGAFDRWVEGNVVLTRQAAHSSTLSIFGNGSCPSGIGLKERFVVPGDSRFSPGESNHCWCSMACTMSIHVPHESCCRPRHPCGG